LEYYYHHAFTNDAELLWLLRELNLSDEIEFKKTTVGIFRNNKIYNFNGLNDLLKFTPLGTSDKIRFLLTSVYLGKLTNWEKWEGVSAWNGFINIQGRMLLIQYGGPYLK